MIFFVKKVNDFFFPDWDHHFIDYFKKTIELRKPSKDYFNQLIGYQEAHRYRALSKVKDFNVAIDCGAHVGLWARDLSNFFDKIYCFEPSREHFECLKVNITKENAILINKALGKNKSKGKLHIPIGSENSGNAIIVKENYLIKCEKDKIVDIEIVPLDLFELKKIDFFKIDVEGLGLNVLKGAIKTLKICNPIICLELFDERENKEQTNFLHKLGYKIVDIYKKDHIFMKT